MRVAIPFLVVLALALPAHAEHCPPESAPRGPLGVVVLGSGEAGSVTYYVVDRDVVLGDGLWVYEESNGEDGVQTGACSDLGDCDAWYGDSRCRPDGYVPDRLAL